MRWLASLVLAAALAGPVQSAPPSWLVPSPLSIVLTVGSWIQKDRIEVFYVQVQAHGRDEADAREQLFRLAVNQAVGSLLLSHTEVRNGDVVRRDLVNYSAGHIHDFRYIKREHRDGGVLIQADVWVRKSQIADRLLSESRAVGRVEGGRISEQIRSFQTERAAADSVLEAVLADYPHRAFDMSVGRTQVVVDNRVTYLQVPITIRWNQQFVTALAEAVKTVNPNPQCDSWLANCFNKSTIVQIGRQRAWFDDDKTFWIFQKALIGVRPQILLQFFDTRGQVISRFCFNTPEVDHSHYASWYFVDIGGNEVKLYPDRVRSGPMMLDTRNLDINRLDRVDVSMVPYTQCP